MTKIVTELDIGDGLVIKDNKLQVHTELVEATLEGMPLRFSFATDNPYEQRYIELTSLHRVVGTDFFLLGGYEEISVTAKPSLMLYAKSINDGMYGEGFYDPTNYSQMNFVDAAQFFDPTVRSYFKIMNNGDTAVHLTTHYGNGVITVTNMLTESVIAQVQAGDTTTAYVDIPFVITDRQLVGNPMSSDWRDFSYSGMKLKVEIATAYVMFTVVDNDLNDHRDTSYFAMLSSGNQYYTNLVQVDRGTE